MLSLPRDAGAGAPPVLDVPVCAVEWFPERDVDGWFPVCRPMSTVWVRDGTAEALAGTRAVLAFTEVTCGDRGTFKLVEGRLADGRDDCDAGSLCREAAAMAARTNRTF